jgi:multiple sugar transport system substrate-binding protein
MDSALPQADRSQFFKGTLDGATYDGKLYAIPWFNNGPGLYYRKDLLDAKGLKPPKTYDELLNAAKQTQTADIVGFAMQLNQGEGGIINWMEFLWGYGGDLVDDKLQVVVDKGTAGVDGMQKILDFVYKDKILPEAALQFNQGADVMNLFRGGKATMIRLWFSNVTTLYSRTAALKQEQWDVAPLPSKDGASPGRLPRHLEPRRLAVLAQAEGGDSRSIKLLTGAEQQKTRFLDAGFLPARPAIFDDAAIQQKYPYAKQAQASFENLKPRPVTPFYPDMSKNAIQPAFGQAMARQITADAAIKQMAEKMRQILKG